MRKEHIRIMLNNGLGQQFPGWAVLWECKEVMEIVKAHEEALYKAAKQQNDDTLNALSGLLPRKENGSVDGESEMSQRFKERAIRMRESEKTLLKFIDRINKLVDAIEERIEVEKPDPRMARYHAGEAEARKSIPSWDKVIDCDDSPAGIMRRQQASERKKEK